MGTVSLVLAASIRTEDRISDDSGAMSVDARHIVLPTACLASSLL